MLSGVFQIGRQWLACLDLLFGGWSLQRRIIFGLIGVTLMYAAVAGLYSIDAPWKIRGDSHQHVDYIWRVYHDHQLPTWLDGITYQPFIKAGWGNVHESAAANPPLFYLVQAPIVGPILATGAWQAAIAVGRGLNIMTGVGCVGMLAWGAWLYGGKRRHMLAVAVPALGVLTYNFTRLNLDYALDAFLLLLTTWSLVLDYQLIARGPKKSYLLLTLLVSILGMSTKAPYILFLSLSLAAVVASFILYGKKLKQSAVRGLLVAGGITLAVVLAIGWFYYFHNYKTSGSLYSIAPSTYTGGRPYESTITVLRSARFWGLLVADYAQKAMVSVVFSCFVVAGYFLITKVQLQKLIRNRKQLTNLGLLALALLGTLAIQLKFASGYGSINFRYMIPALLPIGLFLAYGLLQFTGLRGQLITAAAVLLGLTSLKGLEGGHIHQILAAVQANGLPGVLVILLGLCFVVGAGLLGMSMFWLSQYSPAKSRSR